VRKSLMAVASVLAVLSIHTPATASTSPVVAVLKAGSYVFWNGGHVGSDVDRVLGLAAATAPSCPTAPCFVSELKLASSGARLRVAIDVPERRDAFKVSIVSPSGVSTDFVNVNAFDAEGFVAHPERGIWSVMVSPLTAEQSTFRLRAKLEKTAYEPPRNAKNWAPDLIVPRMWEFGFTAPVTGLAGLSFDDANPPVAAAGMHPFSCTGDEMAEGAHRCLRFSFQLANAGPGNFDVRFDTSQNPQQGAMVQCVERPGKAPFARAAGEYWFHAPHGHYHYQDVVQHRLYRVTDRKKGTMVLAGLGKKLGYHPADQAFAQWDKFTQAPSGTNTSAGNCYAGSNNDIGLSRGWGDAYRWQRPGNFVEFGDNPDGYYVVETVADPKSHLLESDKTNNIGYAYIRVLGDQVQLLETGQGRSPWDAHKAVGRYS
jgi:hypothetical protein